MTEDEVTGPIAEGQRPAGCHELPWDTSPDRKRAALDWMKRMLPQASWSLGDATIFLHNLESPDPKLREPLARSPSRLEAARTVLLYMAARRFGDPDPLANLNEIDVYSEADLLGEEQARSGSPHHPRYGRLRAEWQEAERIRRAEEEKPMPPSPADWFNEER